MMGILSITTGYPYHVLKGISSNSLGKRVSLVPLGIQKYLVRVHHLFVHLGQRRQSAHNHEQSCQCSTKLRYLAQKAPGKNR